MKNSRRCSLAGLLDASVIVLILLTVLGWLGRLYWVFDLFSHFRVQYAVAFLVCGIFLLLLRRWRSAVLSLVFALGLGSTLLPSFARTVQSSAKMLKVVSFNVLTDNDRYDDVIRFIEAENPDVIFLMEVNDQWLEGLGALKTKYPHATHAPREDNFGVALFSKYPFTKSEVLNFGDSALPAVDATIEKDQKPYRLYGIHTLPPSSREDSDSRIEQLFEAADRLGKNPEIPTVLMGDFNLTHFSPWFNEILERGHLVDTSAGAGVSPTWMRHTPLIAIPIDHVLISKNLSLVGRRLGPSLGSDHNPLIVEVTLRP